ncbi:hypothetical protein [Flammeovirga sp. SJP92]|uniref:hypothetical protein n=1 Tax=Flammeovirga sp. SJP92 TaxID=1775430 RepID=UPI0007869BD4|nr:hypothetical protein [Flammeovirga sp. SJP92]KXX72752.1 hypothetical protein AVL50_32140 [Flammeovirga sp. SJP92]
MTKKLTKKQKREIVRLECINLLSQASEALFDGANIIEQDKESLLNGVYEYLDSKRKPNEPDYFGSGKEIVEYVRMLNN